MTSSTTHSNSHLLNTHRYQFEELGDSVEGPHSCSPVTSGPARLRSAGPGLRHRVLGAWCIDARRDGVRITRTFTESPEQTPSPLDAVPPSIRHNDEMPSPAGGLALTPMAELRTDGDQVSGPLEFSAWTAAAGFDGRHPLEPAAELSPSQTLPAPTAAGLRAHGLNLVVRVI
jgi:hypothetical protein